MAIFRIQKNENYTVMSNYHLRDKNLSLKAKGLLSVMLSLPDEWDYSIGGLCSILKENETAVKTALKELKTYGYLIFTKLNPNQTDSGRIEWVYDIFEMPQAEQPTEKQQVEILPVEILPIENPRQINIDILNKEEINTESLKEKNTKKEKSKEPTVLESLKEYESLYNLSSEVMEALEAFTDMRKRIKKPLTLYSLKLLIKRLIELSGNDQTEMVEILNQSIFNSWQGIFAVKKDQAARYEPQEDIVEKLRRKYEEEGI